MIGRKQASTHESFCRAWADIARLVPRSRYEALLDRTVAAVKHQVGACRAGFGWSGGKDSIALEVVCRAAGIDRCVFGMTDHLEYLAFLQWVTDHMPGGLQVIKNGWDLAWLARNQDMLFPQDATTAGKWFKGVQHQAQEAFFREHRLGILLLGRRRVDGNFVGRDGEALYVSRGVVRYSPLADWTHEDVLAYLHYEGWAMADLPPFYRWPRGFRCGTHAWPARQWCCGVRHGWEEVYGIEPDRVREAAGVILSAKEFLAEVE